MSCRLVCVKVVVLLVGLLVFAGAIAPVSADWEFQESGTTENLNDICFVDEYTGWAVGDNSTIIHTTDGGETWVKQECPVKGLTLVKIDCKGKTAICMGRNGPLLVTNNSGKQWIPHDDIKSIGYFGDVFLLNETHGWITAQEVSENREHVYFTSDGGQNWEMIFSYSLHIPALFFADERTGWALRGSYIDNFSSTDVLFTEDGGKNWSTVSRIDDTPNLLSSITGDTLWAGYTGFFVSSNRGANWQSLDNNSLSDYFIKNFYPINEHQVFLFSNKYSGILNFIGYELLLFDRNDDSFEILFHISKDETQFSSRSMCGVNENVLWIAGGEGKIIKYIHQSSNGIETGSLPDTIILEQNKPNPFNLETNISFSIAQAGAVDLSIFSMTGQKLCTLVSEQIQPGTYTYTWEGYDDRNNRIASTGVYFYVLDVNRFKKTGKMLLLK